MTLDQQIIARYAGQPTRLPPELRRRIESDWDGAPVLLYAFADLGPALELAEAWVALGPDQVAFARAYEDRSDFEVTSFPRRRLRRIQSPQAAALIRHARISQKNRRSMSSDTLISTRSGAGSIRALSTTTFPKRCTTISR